MLAPAARIASWTPPKRAGAAAPFSPTHRISLVAYGADLKARRRFAVELQAIVASKQVWMKRSALPLILGVEACADVPQLQPREAPAAKRDHPVDGWPGSLG